MEQRAARLGLRPPRGRASPSSHGAQAGRRWRDPAAACPAAASRRCSACAPPVPRLRRRPATSSRFGRVEQQAGGLEPLVVTGHAGPIQHRAMRGGRVLGGGLNGRSRWIRALRLRGLRGGPERRREKHRDAASRGRRLLMSPPRRPVVRTIINPANLLSAFGSQHAAGQSAERRPDAGYCEEYRLTPRATVPESSYPFPACASPACS